LLALLPVRRALALLGFFAVIALAVTLLYRVYVHHTAAEPYVEDEPAMVELREKISYGMR
jgi:hypothetical protein